MSIVLTPSQVTKISLEILHANLAFAGIKELQVWDGVSFKACSQSDSVGFICGHCSDGTVKYDGDVCPSCFALAIQVEKKPAKDYASEFSAPGVLPIGQTLNIRRPRPFASINLTYGGDPSQPKAPADHTFVKC